jgi:predicted cupin superfamily sugar epimerase
MAMALPAGDVRGVRPGHDIAAGERVQHVIPAGWWQGTQLAPGGQWALLGTTMAPGFRAEGFELAMPAALDGLDAAARAHLEPFLP